MNKIRFEAFLFGAGTAIGELPPYLMAKASRLSGYDPDDFDDLKEFEELNKKRELGVELTPLERAKIFMENAVKKVGFLGIMACASVSYNFLCFFQFWINPLLMIFRSISRFPIHCSI